VIDPRLSETAALADFPLQIRPGTDAWCLAALVGIIVQDGLLALEDLGMQMNLHSTLGSYLQRLVWLLTGHYGRPGTSNAFVPF
ncbi:molybdopterin oxidoreductase family protein, partial [Pseudomonas aeruginosa]|nr:molybdopterin oxidoreductase family protein [Pseudomonas aeruginosa]